MGHAVHLVSKQILHHLPLPLEIVLPFSADSPKAPTSASKKFITQLNSALGDAIDVPKASQSFESHRGVKKSKPIHCSSTTIEPTAAAGVWCSDISDIMSCGIKTLSGSLKCRLYLGFSSVLRDRRESPFFAWVYSEARPFLRLKCILLFCILRVWCSLISYLSGPNVLQALGERDATLGGIPLQTSAFGRHEGTRPPRK